MQQIKVLWFSNTPANAAEFFNKKLEGTGGWLKALDEELQNDVNLYVAFFSTDNKPFRYKNTTYYPIITKISFFYRVLRKFFNYRQKEYDLKEYIRIINHVNPDIIHIHGTELTFGEILGKTSIPIVISIQGNITIYSHKYFSGIEERYVKNLCSIQNTTGSFLSGNIARRTYKLFNIQRANEIHYLAKSKYIIGRTDWDKRISYILAPKCLYFHCDEILRESFYLKQWVKTKNKVTIIHTTTGNSMYKGLETVCYALNLLNTSGSNVEWRIAGVNSDDIIVNLVKRKLKKDYPTRGLVFLGSLTEDQLVRTMLEADIYVMPSHIENSPNSLCEAMSLGMPCISTFAGGTGTLLRDKEEGILIQDGDPWVMAGAIVELSLDTKKAIVFGQKARKRALFRHNKEKIIKELVLIYDKITNKDE